MSYAQAIAAAIQVAGSLMANSQAKADANKNSDIAHHRQKEYIIMQQNWAEKMANSAHQREVADLKAAGLNPILSANGGATTPTVSAPSPNMSQSDKYGENYGNIIPTMLDKYFQNRALELQTTKNQYDNEKTWQEAQLISNQAQTELTNNELKNLEIIEKQIRNEYLPDRQKAELNNILQDTRLKLAEQVQARANTKLTDMKTSSEKVNAIYGEQTHENWKAHPHIMNMYETIRRFRH